MACDLEFQQLANRNPFVKDLDNLGYDLDLLEGYFVIFGLPYLDEVGALQHGDLVSKVDLTEEGIINPPVNDHQVWWRGGQPCHQSRQPLKIAFAQNSLVITAGFEATHSFSFKIIDGNNRKRAYSSFAEKVETYLQVITGPALAAYPGATPFRGIEKKAAAQNSPLRFPDTSSANYGLNDISGLLRGKKIAIVGLGGTGSYILDFLARTHLERIALFDDDKVHMHTIFRMPGFIPRAIGQGKVEALAQHYAQWRSGIEYFRERITEENIDQLAVFDFVFVSVDDGPARRLIVDWLSSKDIPFVDCGMGLNRSKVGLNGMIRVTGVDRVTYERTVGSRFLPTKDAKDDEYRRQAQIVELNALNAALAVIRFKQHFGLFDRDNESGWYTLETASLTIDSEPMPQ